MGPFLKTTLLLSFMAIFSSCGGRPAGYKTVPVSGILRCQGKPIPGIQVLFSPRAENGRGESSPGRSAMARTDDEGKFTLSTYGLNDGAVVGKHTVTLLVLDDPRAPVSAEAKKNVAPCVNSTMEVEVKPGMDEVKLDL